MLRRPVESAQDILIAVVDGQKGLPEAITAAFFSPLRFAFLKPQARINSSAPCWLRSIPLGKYSRPQRSRNIPYFSGIDRSPLPGQQL